MWWVTCADSVLWTSDCSSRQNPHLHTSTEQSEDVFAAHILVRSASGLHHSSWLLSTAVLHYACDICCFSPLVSTVVVDCDLCSPPWSWVLSFHRSCWGVLRVGYAWGTTRRTRKDKLTWIRDSTGELFYVLFHENSTLVLGRKWVQCYDEENDTRLVNVILEVIGFWCNITCMVSLVTTSGSEIWLVAGKLVELSPQRFVE